MTTMTLPVTTQSSSINDDVTTALQGFGDYDFHDGFTNESGLNSSYHNDETDFSNLLNHPLYKCMFIVLYSGVFLLCCVGNSLVLYTIGRNKRMRTRTNFFLANLAVADLGVGVVCVMPKLTTFMTPSWVLGEAMCRIYYFSQSVTYIASVLLLTAISMERYIAILHPLRSKCLVTQNRLIISQIVIWVVSAAYSAPDLYMYGLFINDADGQAFCFAIHPYSYDNMANYYTIHFSLWYILPLCLMTFMYVRICWTLWNTSRPDTQEVAGGQVGMGRLSRERSVPRQDAQTTYDTPANHAVTAARSKHQRHASNGSSNIALIQLGRGRHEHNNNNSMNASSSSSSRSETNATNGQPDTAALTNNNPSCSCDVCSQEPPGISPPVIGHQLFHHQLQYQRHQHNKHEHIKQQHRAQMQQKHPRESQPPSRQNSTGTTTTTLSCYCSLDLSETSSEYDMLNNRGAPTRRMRFQYRMNSKRVFSSRRRVIKLLIMVLLTFTICVFPYHLKNLIFWNHPYPGKIMDVLAPLSFVLLYANSAMNPILYWMFSEAFRRCFIETLERTCMPWRRARRPGLP